MRNIFKYLAAAIVLFSGTTVAYAVSDNLSLSLDMNNAPAYQLAKSYWLGGADIDLMFKSDNDDVECLARGFTKDSCTDGKVPVSYCGSSNQYHKCGCDTSVYKYSSRNCPSDSTPNNDVCDSYSSGCTCNEKGYVWNGDTNTCAFFCSSDSDCSGSMVCNTSDGQCYGCLDNSDCNEGEVCTNHQCVTEDKCKDVSCSGGKSCNPDNGQCECPSGTQDYGNGTCEEANCSNGGVICSGSTPVCASSGKCVECVSNSDCGTDEVCSGNTCQTVDRCANVTCSGGKECNATNGLCECPSGTKDYGSGVCEAPDCSNGGVVCSGGKECKNKVCQCPSSKPFEKSGTCVECTASSQCGNGEECISNYCQLVDACANVTCRSDQICVNGACQCPSGKVEYQGECQAPNCINGGVTCPSDKPACSSSGTCVECASNGDCTGGKTCQSNVCKCPSGKIEYEGSCVTPNCNNAIICSGDKPYCNSSNGECVECIMDGNCSGGKVCTNNTCVCPDDKPYESGGKCVECSSDSNCSNGKTCQNGTCKCPSDKPYESGGKCVECTSDTQCASGETCQSNVCEKPAVRECQAGDIFYSDRTCSNTYVSGKTPLGIVVDPMNRLLLGLQNYGGPMALPNSPAYVGLTSVGNERYGNPGNSSERGYENTMKILQSGISTPSVMYCTSISSSALEGRNMYVPATYEAYMIGLRSLLVDFNQSLSILKNAGISADTLPTSAIWTSDEAFDDNNAMIVISPQALTGGRAKKDSTQTFRCVARYKCPTGMTCNNIQPYMIGSTPMNSYIKGSASCMSPYFKETFYWNGSYSRCVYDLPVGGSSGGGDKEACQVGDYVYNSGGATFCSVSSSEAGTKIGRVTYNKYIISYQSIGTASSSSSASSQCSRYSGGGLQWYIPTISDIANLTMYLPNGSGDKPFWLSGAGAGNGNYYDPSTGNVLNSPTGQRVYYNVRCKAYPNNIYRK